MKYNPLSVQLQLALYGAAASAIGRSLARIPAAQIGKGRDHTWRGSRGFASRRARANRRKARRKARR